jgi:hypothetical protein
MPVPKPKPLSYVSPLWPPPGDPRAAHHCTKGEKCRCGPIPTTLLLHHAPSPSDLTRALCGSTEGSVDGVDFVSVTTCEECRARLGLPRELLGKGSRVVYLAAPSPDAKGAKEVDRG